MPDIDLFSKKLKKLQKMLEEDTRNTVQLMKQKKEQEQENASR